MLHFAIGAPYEGSPAYFVDMGIRKLRSAPELSGSLPASPPGRTLVGSTKSVGAGSDADTNLLRV